MPSYMNTIVLSEYSNIMRYTYVYNILEYD